jgi:hypothetical protein
VTQGFEVSHTTSGARGMRAILHRQIEAAIAALPRHDPTDEEIHAARKQMKAARATPRCGQSSASGAIAPRIACCVMPGGPSAPRATARCW